MCTNSSVCVTLCVHSFITPSYANFKHIDGNIFEPHLEDTKHHKTKKDTYLER